MTADIQILQGKIDSLHERIEIFSWLVTEKDAEQLKAREEQVSVMNKNITDTKEKMTEAISKVDIDNLVIKDTPPNDAIDTLKRQKKKFDE